MTKKEYIAELNTHLLSLPDEERINAVNFYEEYFEDAGPENEQAVIDELGKPFNLAKSIVCEQSAYSKSKSYAKFRESIDVNRFSNTSASKPSQNDKPVNNDGEIFPGQASSASNADEIYPNGSSKPHTQYTAYNYSYQNQTQDTDNSLKTDENPYTTYKQNYEKDHSYTAKSSTASAKTQGSELDFVIGLLIIIFILIPLAVGLFMVFVAFAITAVALIVSALIAIVYAISHISTIGTAMFYFGASMLLTGLAFLSAIPAILGFGKFTPWVIKTLNNFFKTHKL